MATKHKGHGLKSFTFVSFYRQYQKRGLRFPTKRGDFYRNYSMKSIKLAMLFAVSCIQTSILSAGYIKPTSLPSLLNASGTSISVNKSYSLSISAIDINEQAKNLALGSPKKSSAIKIIRFEIDNNTNSDVLINIRNLIDHPLVDRAKAFSIAGVSHPYIRDIILYFGISSLACVMGTNILTSGQASALLSALSLDTASLKSYILMLSILPPAIKTIFNIYSYIEERRFFSLYDKKEAVVPSGQHLVVLAYSVN